MIANPPAEVHYLARQHNRTDQAFLHTDLDKKHCACRFLAVVSARPQQTGETCRECGGMAVRTGTCTTCTECGTTGGCG